MQRRTFLQSLSALFLPLVVRPAQPTDPRDGPAYSDSETHTEAELRTLHDANTRSGGIRYDA